MLARSFKSNYLKVSFGTSLCGSTVTSLQLATVGTAGHNACPQQMIQFMLQNMSYFNKKLISERSGCVAGHAHPWNYRLVYDAYFAMIQFYIVNLSFCNAMYSQGSYSKINLLVIFDLQQNFVPQMCSIEQQNIMKTKLNVHNKPHCSKWLNSQDTSVFYGQ